MTNANDKQNSEKKTGNKPGYDCPVERNPHKDMLASITMDGDTEVAKWFHRGNHVFTVRTDKAGNMSYKTAIDE